MQAHSHLLHTVACKGVINLTLLKRKLRLREYMTDLHRMAVQGRGYSLSRHLGHLPPIAVAQRGVQRALSPGRTRPRGWLSGKDLSYLVEPMVQQDNLCLSRVRALSHQHVPWVGVAVHEAVDKDHLTVHLAQVARDLKEQGGRRELSCINTCLRLPLWSLSLATFKRKARGTWWA